ncbi:hypothetical protein FOCC_FOCC012505 [Frankliniella occidentalis]|nr:hypothetical protein FOCC_FOCC012505 [Frankliniella occidentalis]
MFELKPVFPFVFRRRGPDMQRVRPLLRHAPPAGPPPAEKAALRVLGVRQPVPVPDSARAPQGGVRALVRRRAQRGPGLLRRGRRGQPGDGLQRGARAAALRNLLPATTLCKSIMHPHVPKIYKSFIVFVHNYI